MRNFNLKDFFIKHKIKWIIAAGVIAVVIVVGLVAIYASNKGKEASAAKAAQEESDDEETQDESALVDNGDDPQPENQNEDGVKINASDLNISKNDYEVSGITYGIDVSKWQGKISWDKVKASGIEYAMIRIGYRTEGNGTICEDTYAAYNLQQAIKAGIKVGVYFFSTAVSTAEAQEEAAWVADYIAKYSITYPVVYNCEGYDISDSRMHQLSNDDRTNNALAFLDYISGQGYTPMFYANSSEVSDSAYWDTNRISSKYKMWIAQYPNTAFTSDLKSSYSGKHDMWQYTNNGKVNGISGYVDMNVAYFGYSKAADPKTAGGVAEVTAPTQAATAYDPYTNAVNEKVTAKDETNLRTAASTTDDSTVVYLLKKGEYVTRTAIGTNGWSKVVYNGQTLYAKTSYLITEAELAAQSATQPAATTTTAFDPFADKNFTEVNEQVTAKSETNLRTVPNSLGNDPVYSLKYGEYVTRTGIDDNTGWSRVVYNGQTLYAVSSLLTK